MSVYSTQAGFRRQGPNYPATGYRRRREGLVVVRKAMIAGLIMVLVLAFAVLAGCGGESSETTESMAGESVPATTPEESAELPPASPGAYTDLTAQQAAELIDSTPGLVIIDVSPNYAEGHLPGAVNYYLGDGSLEKAIPGLDKDAPYLVYCHVDSVSISGAQALVDAGFTTVYRLQGNYAAWVDAGYPVEK